MDFWKRPYLLTAIFLVLLSLFLRYHFLPFQNGDLLMNLDWFIFLQQNGYKGLANSEFSNYSPPYLYLLLILSFIKGELPPAIGLKIIPSLFDLLSAFSIYKIARLKLKSDMSFLLAAGFFTLPTVMLNSSGWGQVDSMYGSQLLLCLYLLLTERPFPALAVFGLAFSFKLQAIFLLPFLGILFLRKKIYWYHFLVLPIVYALTMLPAFLAGRSWQSILQVYTGQATQYDNLARYAPNLYFLIPIDYFHPVFEIGMGIFFVCMLAWAWANWRAKPPVTQHQLVLTALASAALVPFLLPKMLDRYFYPADLFSFVAAIFIPQLWFIPLFFQLSSGLAYTIFMFGMPPLMALPGALINTALVIIIIRQQLASLKAPQGDIHAQSDQ